MKQDNNIVYLHHVLDAIDKIESYLVGHDEDSLLENIIGPRWSHSSAHDYRGGGQASLDIV